MSDQPPAYPPAVPPATPARAARQSYSDWFRTSPWWHKVLVLLPLLLAMVGGLLGVLTGLFLATANLSVLRSRLGTGAKVAVCVVIIAVGSATFLLVVAVVEALLGLYSGK